MALQGVVPRRYRGNIIFLFLCSGFHVFARDVVVLGMWSGFQVFSPLSPCAAWGTVKKFCVAGLGF